MKKVALRKESVDRNRQQHGLESYPCQVALRKESVDRNVGCLALAGRMAVALRKESVDRNTTWRAVMAAASGGRSPQGERG